VKTVEGRPYNRFRAKEDSVLIEARFEPTENRLVWKKHGLWFGREAALQAAFLERRERDR
jgi:hypothetical protein